MKLGMVKNERLIKSFQQMVNQHRIGVISSCVLKETYRREDGSTSGFVWRARIELSNISNVISECLRLSASCIMRGGMLDASACANLNPMKIKSTRSFVRSLKASNLDD